MESKNYPFEVFSEEGQFAVTYPIRGTDDDLFKLLESFEIYGNGYGWEGVIEQILEKVAPEMLGKYEPNSEGGAFVAVFENKKDQKEFLSTICPILQDVEKLKGFLAEIDLDRIDA